MSSTKSEWDQLFQIMSCSKICIKRQVAEDESSDKETKKLRSELIPTYCDQLFRKNPSDILDSSCSTIVTCLEDLSNELFYEIFDYLDGHDIFNMFSDLNTRFHHLVTHSSVQFKSYGLAAVDGVFVNHFYQFVLPNSHRMISLHIHDLFYGLCFSSSLRAIDESFNCLESLVLNGISLNCLLPLLSNLIILPRLFSLKIVLDRNPRNYAQLYAMIFLLPSLKYHKLSTCHKSFNTIMPYSSTDHFSPIEHLVLDHSCDIYELSSILSYTPRLSRLTCDNLKPMPPTNWTISTNLLHLKYISINMCHLPFDKFEVAFKYSLQNIRCLRFGTVDDMSYFDAERWEALILKYMPHLQILDLTYPAPTLHQHTLEASHLLLHRFNSPFWIVRGWLLQVHIQLNTFSSSSITYAIQTLRQQWNQFEDYVANRTNANHISIRPLMAGEDRHNTLFPFLELIIENTHFLEYYYSGSKEYICKIISLVPFTSLRFTSTQFSIPSLLQLLELLPHLDALTISSKYPEGIRTFSLNQLNRIRSLSASNKITKVKLEQMTELDQVHLLMDICSQMQHFRVNCRNSMDVEWLVRYVFKKRNANFIPNLRSLSFGLSESNDETIRHLRMIIDTEKLVDSYTIKRTGDRIYLQWNEHL